MSNLEIDTHSVQHWLGSGIDNDGKPIALIDCREPDEYEIARIDGAQLVPMSQWPPPQFVLNSLLDKRVIVHCHHGGRSLRVVHWFRQNGYPDALSMSGGIDEWSEQIDTSIPRY